MYIYIESKAIAARGTFNMEKHINKEGEARFLEEARLKSKEFYIKATQNAVEEAFAVAEQAGEAAQDALVRLGEHEVAGEVQTGTDAKELIDQSVACLKNAAQVMAEAAEAVRLAMSVTQ